MEFELGLKLRLKLGLRTADAIKLELEKRLSEGLSDSWNTYLI